MGKKTLKQVQTPSFSILKNYKRKLISLIASFIIWFSVNQTINETVSIQDVPIRIINIAPDLTANGAISNSILKQKTSITLTGNKKTLSNLKSSDLEIVIDASNHLESWLEPLNLNNVVFCKQKKELKKHIKKAAIHEMFIHISHKIHDYIPVIIKMPLGKPPQGYKFIDVWPKTLYQKVCGSKEQIDTLKEKGIFLRFNLNDISKEELDKIYSSDFNRTVKFEIPKSWKKLPCFLSESNSECLTDKNAEQLTIYFLKQDLVPLNVKIPVIIFPNTLDPDRNYQIIQNKTIIKLHNNYFLNIELYAKNVSDLFLEIIKPNIAMNVFITKTDNQHLAKTTWSIDILNKASCEDAFVNAYHSNNSFLTEHDEKIIRDIFRDFTRELTLNTISGADINLNITVVDNNIIISEAKNAFSSQPIKLTE